MSIPIPISMINKKQQVIKMFKTECVKELVKNMGGFCGCDECTQKPKVVTGIGGKVISDGQRGKYLDW